MKRRDITYADWLKIVRAWRVRSERGENLRAPEMERVAGYFAQVDGVLYRYVG